MWDLFFIELDLIRINDGTFRCNQKFSNISMAITVTPKIYISSHRSINDRLEIKGFSAIRALAIANQTIVFIFSISVTLIQYTSLTIHQFWHFYVFNHFLIVERLLLYHVKFWDI